MAKKPAKKTDTYSSKAKAIAGAKKKGEKSITFNFKNFKKKK